MIGKPTEYIVPYRIIVFMKIKFMFDQVIYFDQFNYSQ